MKPRLSFSSVRVRLALWNVGVMALVLVGLGVVFSLSVRANIRAAVDHRLSQRARHMQRFFAHGPMDMVAGALSGQDPHAPPGQGPGSGPRGPHDELDFGDLHPRLFGLQGRPIPHENQPGDPPWDRAGLRLALQGKEGYATVRDGADPVRVFSAPLRRDGKIIAAVQWGNSLTHIYQEEARTTGTLLTLIPLVLLIAGLGGAFLTDRALRPVRRITHAAGKIEAENLSRRLPVTGDDEFADLAETFNGMLARLQTAFERQEEAFEQQRRFTADASHELRTPLTIIKAHTSLALSGTRTAPELLKTVQTVNTAADRMTRIVQDLLLLARSDAGQLTYPLVPVSLSEALTQAVAGLVTRDGAPITIALPPLSLWVEGQTDALIRLFGNLLENAARYTPASGRIAIAAEAMGDRVIVTVTDTGEGIAPEHLPHVTERFYRVEAARSRPKGGTGLGLAICRSIVEAHHGALAIESAPGQGTTVRVTLMRAADGPTPLKDFISFSSSPGSIGIVERQVSLIEEEKS